MLSGDRDAQWYSVYPRDHHCYILSVLLTQTCLYALGKSCHLWVFHVGLREELLTVDSLCASVPERVGRMKKNDGNKMLFFVDQASVHPWSRAHIWVMEEESPAVGWENHAWRVTGILSSLVEKLSPLFVLSPHTSETNSLWNGRCLGGPTHCSRKSLFPPSGCSSNRTCQTDWANVLFAVIDFKLCSEKLIVGQSPFIISTLWEFYTINSDHLRDKPFQKIIMFYLYFLIFL